MPLGGFCEVCDRWVWLTPYGACENGHPATKVRDVQQLKASTATGVAPYEGEYAPFAPGKARFRFWWRHSLWIGWTFTLGFFNWLAFVYIGVRARHAAWTLAGFAYLMPLILTAASFGTPLFRGFVALQLFVSAASVAHALYLRPYYRAVMFGDAPRNSLPAPPQDPRLLPPAERPALPRGIDEAAGEVILAARRQVDAVRETAGAIGKRGRAGQGRAALPDRRPDPRRARHQAPQGRRGAQLSDLLPRRRAAHRRRLRPCWPHGRRARPTSPAP